MSKSMQCPLQEKIGHPDLLVDAASPDADTIAAAPDQAPSGSGGHGHATVLREEATTAAASGAAQGQTPSSGGY